MSTETIIVERDAGVVTVTLNRPERKNAGNGLMWQELYDTFSEEVAAGATTGSLVVTGAGGAFCSGADIADPKRRQRRPRGPPPHPHAFLRSGHAGPARAAQAHHRQDPGHRRRARA